MTQTPLAVAHLDGVKATSSTVEEQKIALVDAECGQCQLANDGKKRPEITVI